MTGQQGEREALAQQHARARRAAAFPHHRYDGRPPQPDDYVAADVTLAALAAQPAHVVPSAEVVRAEAQRQYPKRASAVGFTWDDDMRAAFVMGAAWATRGEKGGE